jgi:inner membrane protein
MSAIESIANWQTYVALGLILIIIEAFATTFFLFPLGASLMATAVIAPFVSFEVEMLVFTFMCFSNFFISLKIVKPYFKGKKNLSGVDSLVGKVLTAQEDIDESNNTGSVKLYADEWRAVSLTGETILKGTKVKIEKVEGNKVFVVKA